MDRLNETLISIIVPIYNVENYLCQCVDSILAQSFDDFELILVDDGSSDNCPVICDDYASGDNRIKVIHKVNGGLSDARNAGMGIALGRYLLFIDGDDFIGEESLNKIAQALERDQFPDVMFLNAKLYFSDGTTAQYGCEYSRVNYHGLNHKKVLNNLTVQNQFHVSACVKIIKRKLVIDNSIHFTKGIIGEDVDFSIKLYLNAVTYSYFDVPYYFYRQDREDSIMARKDNKRFNDLIFIVKKWIDLSDDEYSLYRKWIFRFLFHQYYILISLYNGIDKNIKPNELKEIKEFFKSNSYLLRYTYNKKALLLYAFYKLFGIRLTSYLINKLEGTN